MTHHRGPVRQTDTLRLCDMNHCRVTNSRRKALWRRPLATRGELNASHILRFFVLYERYNLTYGGPIDIWFWFSNAE